MLMLTRLRHWRCWLLAPVLLTFVLLPATTVEAKSVSWDAIDVEIALQPDGVLRVTQREEIRFTGGPFRTGFIALSLARTEGIENISVSEIVNGEVVPYQKVTVTEFEAAAVPGMTATTGGGVDLVYSGERTFTVLPSRGDLEIRYRMGETSDQVRVMQFSYDVLGALRVYPNETPPNQQIWWTAIGEETTEIGDVRRASVTITLPKLVDPAAVVLGEQTAGPASEHTSDGQTWRWDYTNLGFGSAVRTRMQFPPVANAEVPGWQAVDDTRREAVEDRERRTALTNVIFLGIAIGIVALGGVGLYSIWYLRGRDPEVGLVASFLAEPPDDLPAGLVGALLDETVNEHDLIAAVADFGRRGILKIDPVTARGAFGPVNDFELTMLEGEHSLRSFEREVLTALYGKMPDAGATVKLGEVKGRFGSAAPRIRDAMYADLVAAGYFTESPHATRHRWRTTSGLLNAVLIGAGITFGVLGMRTNGYYWAALIAAFGLSFAIRRVGRRMPRKTEAGAMAAAKWRAFRTYLQDIDRYDRVNESKEILERYLAFAVAFGLEKAWVARFATAGAMLPPWFGQGGQSVGPLGGDPWHGYPSRGGRPVIGGAPGVPGTPGMPNLPDLQDMSDAAGRSLEGGSGSLMSMLTLAAEVFSEAAGSGGFSGGGRSGGGRSGGAGGGGRRGFS